MFKRVALGVIAAGALVGCAALTAIHSDVSSYGTWPAERAPGTFAFERLPSQQAQPERQARLEEAARAALEQAGFREAGDAASADVTVQVGARVTRHDRSPWDDPFWWRWGAGYWRHPGWYGGPWYPGHLSASPIYDREVALLIRDRRSGTPLYETRATSDGYSAGGVDVLAAMFEAALKDFPTPAVNPRRVTVPIARTQ